MRMMACGLFTLQHLLMIIILLTAIIIIITTSTRAFVFMRIHVYRREFGAFKLPTPTSSSSVADPPPDEMIPPPRRGYNGGVLLEHWLVSPEKSAKEMGDYVEKLVAEHCLILAYGGRRQAIRWIQMRTEVVDAAVAALIYVVYLEEAHPGGATYPLDPSLVAADGGLAYVRLIDTQREAQPDGYLGLRSFYYGRAERQREDFDFSEVPNDFLSGYDGVEYWPLARPNTTERVAAAKFTPLGYQSAGCESAPVYPLRVQKVPNQRLEDYSGTTFYKQLKLAAPVRTQQPVLPTDAVDGSNTMLLARIELYLDETSHFCQLESKKIGAIPPPCATGNFSPSPSPPPPPIQFPPNTPAEEVARHVEQQVAQFCLSYSSKQQLLQQPPRIRLITRRGVEEEAGGDGSTAPTAPAGGGVAVAAVVYKVLLFSPPPQRSSSIQTVHLRFFDPSAMHTPAGYLASYRYLNFVYKHESGMSADEKVMQKVKAKLANKNKNVGLLPRPAGGMQWVALGLVAAAATDESFEQLRDEESSSGLPLLHYSVHVQQRETTKEKYQFTLKREVENDPVVRIPDKWGIPRVYRLEQHVQVSQLGADGQPLGPPRLAIIRAFTKVGVDLLPTTTNAVQGNRIEVAWVEELMRSARETADLEIHYSPNVHTLLRKEIDTLRPVKLSLRANTGENNVWVPNAKDAFHLHQHVRVARQHLDDGRSQRSLRSSAAAGKLAIICEITILKPQLSTANDRAHAVQDAKDSKWKQITVAWVDHVTKVEEGDSETMGETRMVHYSTNLYTLHNEEIMTMTLCGDNVFL